MCSGKTSVGKILAKLLQRRHIDLDRHIEQHTGPLIPYFKEHGEASFRELETKALKELAVERDVVISTGGGTPCVRSNLQLMKQAGTVIWLDLSKASLMPRIIRAGGDRPLLFGLKGEELDRRVSELLAVREPVYAEAHIIAQASDPPDMVAQRLADVLRLQAR